MVASFRRRACQNIQRLSQDTLLAILAIYRESQYDFLTSMELDEWQILSFNPEVREVCVQLLKNPQGIITITINLPQLIAK